MAEEPEPRRLTTSVEAAGKILGISRGSAYSAARNGELPGVLRIGGRYLVSVVALNKALQIDDGHDD
jgi:predicted DNA-binding transcriptional regulator AlpA